MMSSAMIVFWYSWMAFVLIVHLLLRRRARRKRRRVSVAPPGLIVVPAHTRFEVAVIPGMWGAQADVELDFSVTPDTSVEQVKQRRNDEIAKTLSEGNFIEQPGGVQRLTIMSHPARGEVIGKAGANDWWDDTLEEIRQIAQPRSTRVSLNGDADAPPAEPEDAIVESGVFKAVDPEEDAKRVERNVARMARLTEPVKVVKKLAPVRAPRLGGFYQSALNTERYEFWDTGSADYDGKLVLFNSEKRAHTPTPARHYRDRNALTTNSCGFLARYLSVVAADAGGQRVELPGHVMVSLLKGRAKARHLLKPMWRFVRVVEGDGRLFEQATSLSRVPFQAEDPARVVLTGLPPRLKVRVVLVGALSCIIDRT